MRQAIVSIMLCLGLAAGGARAASLIGEDIIVRLDSQGVPFQTVTVGAGPEISGLASPPGYPWAWTVDFGAGGFTATAVTTEALAPNRLQLYPVFAFASSTPGLIPVDLGSISLTEAIARNGDTNAEIAGDFELLPNVDVTGRAGHQLSFSAGGSTLLPAGSFVRWTGTLTVAETAVPLPAPGLLLLGGLAALGLARSRRRA